MAKDKGVVDTLKVIGQLRRRVREARTNRTSIRVNNALEYSILQQGLELLTGTIQAHNLLGNPEER